MQLQGIVFIQLQGNYILVNCQGNTDLFKQHIYIHKNIIIRGNYILTRNYIHSKEPYHFVQGNISSSVNENILIQGNYIHSRKYVHLRSIYLFKFKAICSFNETIFVEHCCIRGIAEIFIQKLFPATLS